MATSQAAYQYKPTSETFKSESRKIPTLNYLNLAAYVLNFIVTFTVGQTSLLGPTNAEISAKYQTLLTPAPWAFAIWGLIFTWEGIFAVNQLLPRTRHSDTIQQGVGPYWILMCLFQIGWVLTFSLEALQVSLVFMLGIFASLAKLVLNLNKHTQSAFSTSYVNTPKDYLLTYLPFSINFAWIVAATILNINVSYVFRSPSDSTNQLALAILSSGLIAVASAFGSFVIKDPAFCITILWAAAGIVQQLRNPPVPIQKLFPSLVIKALTRSSVGLSGLAALGVLGTGAYALVDRAGGIRNLLGDKGTPRKIQRKER